MSQQTCLNFSFTDLEMVEAMKIIDGVRYMIAQATKLLDEDRKLKYEDRKMLLQERNKLFPIEKKLINQIIDQKEKLIGVDAVAAEMVLGKYKRL